MNKVRENKKSRMGLSGGGTGHNTEKPEIREWWARAQPHLFLRVISKSAV